MPNPNRLVIAISAPSCGGKTTCIEGVLKQRPKLISKVVTSTTRPPREGELNGLHYYFYPEEVFHQKVLMNEFIENDGFSKARYGTEHQAVESIIKAGFIPIVSVTLPGIRSFHDAYPNTYSIYLMPRNINEIALRIMRERKSVDPDDIKRRLDHAQEEMASWHTFCNAAVVTDDGKISRTIPEVVNLIDATVARFEGVQRQQIANAIAQ